MQVSNWFVNHRGRVWQPLVVQMGQEIEEEEQQQEAARAAAAAGAQQTGQAFAAPLLGAAQGAAGGAAAGSTRAAAAVEAAHPPSVEMFARAYSGAGTGTSASPQPGMHLQRQPSGISWPDTPESPQPWSQRSALQSMQLQPQHVFTSDVSRPTSQHGGPAAAAAQHDLWSMGCGLQRQLESNHQQQQQQQTRLSESSYQQPAGRDTPAAAASVSKAGNNVQFAAPWQPAMHPKSQPTTQLPLLQPAANATTVSAAAPPGSAGADLSPPRHPHSPEPVALPSPPGSQMTAEAAQRLSGSPLLGSLLVALRQPSRPAVTSGPAAAAGIISSGKRDSQHRDLDALEAAAEAAVGGGRRGGSHARRQRLSPQTPDTQPTRSQQSQDRA